jgi:hypothetical protein
VATAPAAARELIEATVRGYRVGSPAERAGFGMLSAFAVTVATARAVNYGRERGRRAPRLRSWARRAYHTPGGGELRVHHFVPGIGLTFIAGGGAILIHSDGHETWLGPLFGTGAGLVLDEIGLLLQADNPYWGSEALALAQSAVAALGATALAIRFSRQTRPAPSEPRQ